MSWERLSDVEKADHRRHSEAELTALVDSIKRLVPAADLSQVEEYLDHAEYGLALEGVYDLLVKRQVHVLHVDRERIVELAQHMGLQGTVIAERLP